MATPVKREPRSAETEFERSTRNEDTPTIGGRSPDDSDELPSDEEDTPPDEGDEAMGAENDNQHQESRDNETGTSSTNAPTASDA
jgi:hypothetical protein